MGIKYIGVSGDPPDYCKEVEIISDEIERVGEKTESDPCPRELEEYLAIRESNGEMAKAERIDEGTIMANDMARTEDQCRIEEASYTAKSLLVIWKIARISGRTTEMG